MKGNGGTGERPLAGAPVRRAMGLALREAGDEGYRQSSPPRDPKAGREAGRLVRLAALVVIAAIAVAGWKRWEQYAADREKVRLAGARDAVQAEIAKINAEIAPFRQAAEVQRGEAAALSTLRSVRRAGRASRRFSGKWDAWRRPLFGCRRWRASRRMETPARRSI